MAAVLKKEGVMSYERMAREALECDFPYCTDEFDQKKNAKVAIVKNGENLAFCKKHAERLKAEGVKLRSLEAIHAEQKAAEEVPMKNRQREIEDTFINDLNSLPPA